MIASPNVEETMAGQIGEGDRLRFLGRTRRVADVTRSAADVCMSLWDEGAGSMVIALFPRSQVLMKVSAQQ